MFEWDEAKSKTNHKKHGVHFDAVWEMDWGSVVRIPDERFEYGETRIAAIGEIKDRLHVCIYTERGSNYRIISLRKANERERKDYGKEIFNH